MWNKEYSDVRLHSLLAIRMMSGLVLFALVATLPLQGIWTGTPDRSGHQHLTSLLRKISDPDVLPRTKDNKPLEVTLSLSLINIAEVDMDKNEVLLYVWQTISWRNIGLAWTPTEFDNLTSLTLPLKYLWTPDITVYNAVRHSEDVTPELAVIAHDGTVSQFPSRRLNILCDVSELSTPSGATCTVKVGSWTNDGSKITLTEPSLSSLDTSGYFSASRYKLLDTKASKNVMYYDCCPEFYEDIRFQFTFEMI